MRHPWMTGYRKLVGDLGRPLSAGEVKAYLAGCRDGGAYVGERRTATEVVEEAMAELVEEDA